MPLTSSVRDIAHVIQLAIRRRLVGALAHVDAANAPSAQAELQFVERRVRLIYTAILLAVVAALLSSCSLCSP
ncbi:MAG TPA: hypothetical protein VM183_15340 [Burkholderiales bacterium]|nr:hypothetical protein [Burkholderiales bacterium]